MKRHLPMLSTLLLAAALAACASDGDTPQSSTQAETNAQTEADGNVYEADTLPAGLDLNGDTITLGYYFGYQNQVAPLEETGEILDDEIFRRNKRVEERLNVTIDAVSIDVEWPDYLPYVRNIVTSGDDAIDAFHLWQYDFAPQIVDNLFLELSDLPYVDYKKPWWATDYMKEQSVDGDSIYFLMGDINYGMMANMTCCFYNKNLYANYFDDGDGLYETVLDGDWTMDALSELCKSYYSDVNGNGEVDPDDILGFGAIHGNAAPPVYFFYNMGCTFSERGSDGYPVLNPATERNLSAIDKMVELFNNTVGCYFFGEDTGEVNALYNQHFIDGKSGFFFGKLEYLTTFRGMEDDFGIIPFPKYDDTQETYLSLVSGAAGMFGIPSYVQELEGLGAVMEALASDSHRSVMPLYYETILKEKYSRDKLSSQVIDILHDNPVTDFVYAMMFGYETEIKYIVQSTGQNTFSSYAEKNRKAMEKKLQKFIDADNDNG